MKIGIIGTGLMGKNHIRIYSDLRGVEEIYITDVNQETAGQVANQFGVKTCSSIEDILEKVDAVSICVPTAFHCQVTKKVLEKEIPCLIEKPVVSTPEEADEIKKLAEKAKVVVGVGHVERFNPVISEVKKIAEEPRYIEVERHNPHFGRITDTDVLDDLMIHDIDFLWNYIFAERKYKIIGAGAVRDRMLELVVALIDFEGCIVKLSGSRISAKKIRQISVEDDGKTLVGDLMTQEIYVHKKTRAPEIRDTGYSQESIVDKVLLSKVEPLREELRIFLDCVRNNKPFPISVEDGSRALKIAAEIREKVGT